VLSPLWSGAILMTAVRVRWKIDRLGLLWRVRDCHRGICGHHIRDLDCHQCTSYSGADTPPPGPTINPYYVHIPSDVVCPPLLFSLYPAALLVHCQILRCAEFQPSVRC